MLIARQREIFLFLVTLAAWAQPTALRPIRAIRFLPAQQPIPDAELRALLPFQSGDLPTPAIVRSAMAALHRTGRYTNIQVEQDPSGDLLFRTTLQEFIGSVDLTGAPATIARGGLINSARLPLGVPFDPSLLNQSLESLESELRLEGYYESQLRYDLIRDPTHHQVSIRFSLIPGPRARFGQPVLRGRLSPLTPRDVFRATRWKPFYSPTRWRFLSEQRIQSGLRGILEAYRKRDFLMARATLERLEYQPASRLAIPNLRLDSGPRVEVRSIGAKIPSHQLRRLVPIFEEQSIDSDLLMEGNRKIAAFLHAKGFFDAKVTHEVEQDSLPVDEIDPTKDAYVDFNIERGQQFRVAAVRLSGNRFFRDDTLRERMAIRPTTLLRYRKGRYTDELLAGDADAIEQLYRSNGFLAVKVHTDVQHQFRNRENLVSINLSIDEGPQTLIEEVIFDTLAESDRDILARYVSAAPGQPYSLPAINSDRDRILNLLYQSGYSQATLNVQASEGSAPHRIRLTFSIEAGQPHFVREVVVTGLGKTNAELVNKRITLTPGEPLNNTEIYAAQRRLYDLGIFARVDTAVQNPDGDEVSKVVLFHLEEASKYSVNGGLGAEIARIGGGITSFDSPAGGAGFSPRLSLGLNRTNFLGLGHTVGAQTRLSNIQRRVLLSYLAPQFRDSNRFSLTNTILYDDARNVRTFNSKRLEGSLQLAQRFNLANSLQYRFTYRRVTTDENTIKVDPALIPLLAQPVRVGSFSSTFIQDRRDDPTDATRGRYTTVDFGVASKAFASSTNFLRLLTRNSSYYRLGRDLVFARSVNLGILVPYRTAGLTPQTDIPLPERFFAGGAYSHRGFPENQAGPRDLITGFPIGGKALLVNNLELRFPLIGDNLGGVFFHDAGNVYSELKNIRFDWRQRDIRDFDYMVHSIGFGIRYRTPIGPVRVDLAFTPNSARFNGFEGTREDLLFGRGRAAQLRVNQFQFHISLGQAF